MYTNINNTNNIIYNMNLNQFKRYSQINKYTGIKRLEMKQLVHFLETLLCLLLLGLMPLVSKLKRMRMKAGFNMLHWSQLKGNVLSLVTLSM